MSRPSAGRMRSRSRSWQRIPKRGNSRRICCPHGALALNNPDLATNVATFVPGTGTGLAKMSGDVNRSPTMLNSAKDQGTPNTSVILREGYDAPQGYAAAADRSYADTGAEEFSERTARLACGRTVLQHGRRAQLRHHRDRRRRRPRSAPSRRSPEFAWPAERRQRRIRREPRQHGRPRRRSASDGCAARPSAATCLVNQSQGRLDRDTGAFG